MVEASQQTNQALESNRLKLAELTPEQKATTSAMEGAGKAAKETGRSVDRELVPAVEKATGKMGEHRAILRGLRETFPTLLPVAEMAFHPIMLLGMALGGAFALLKARVQEAAAAMSEAQLPDISPAKVGQVTAMAEAWKQYREALDGTVHAYNSVEGAAQRAEKALEREANQQKQLLAARKGLELATLEAGKTKMPETEYERRKLGIEDRYERAGVAADLAKTQGQIGLKEKEAADLRSDAARKMAESSRIKVGTADQDAAMVGDYAKQKSAAESDIKEHEE